METGGDRWRGRGPTASLAQEWRKSLSTPIMAEKCLLDMNEEELLAHHQRVLVPGLSVSSAFEGSCILGVDRGELVFDGADILALFIAI